jgi:ketosteroid isomerase-like protein
MLTLDQQKERVRQFMRALDCGDQAAMTEMVAPNFVFELMAAAPGFPQSLDRVTFLENFPKTVRQMMPNGFNYKFDLAIAEGPHVAMQGTNDGITGTGKKYANRYHWYFRFVGDKIDRFVEYVDSYVAAEAFAS